MYFFTTANVADVKLETDILENIFCREKENNLLYTFFYLSYYDHATIANVMFCNQLSFWLLAEALFYMYM